MVRSFYEINVDMSGWFDMEMQSCIEQDRWALREEGLHGGNKWPCFHRNIFGRMTSRLFKQK